MESTTPSKREFEFVTGIMDSLPVGVIALDREGMIRMINRAGSEILGIPREAKVLDTLLTHYLDKNSVLYDQIINSLNEGDTEMNIESFPYNHQKININGKRLSSGWLITILLVTGDKEMEDQSIRSMVRGQESERKRLSKEIHDGLSPLLSTIKINLESIRMETEKFPPNTTLNDKLKGIHELIDTLAEDMRQISHSLMPKVLEDFGLGAALESLCNRFVDNEQVGVHYYHAGYEERLDKSTELNLYRIAQELVHNALKHSRASQINIQLIRHQQTLMLMVEDNGAGFDKSQLHQADGLGLRNIETRTRMSGGSFYLDTGKGKGVTATVEVPLKKFSNHTSII